MRQTILFMAANPVGTERLALDLEEHVIRDELERGTCRDRIELISRWAVQPLDFLRTPRKLKPTIVHFSGHGRASVARPNQDSSNGRDIATDADSDLQEDHGGLYVQGLDGRAQYVSADALKEAFGAMDVPVRVVVLNACYSARQADALLPEVDCVVGIRGTISDSAARNFSIGFYGSLGDGQSVETAYKQGCAAIHLESLPYWDRPKLLARPGVDAAKLTLI